VTGNDSQQQREVARAIKNAREMALVPYTNRVTTQRGGNKNREDRGDRRDGPPPTPSVPPPPPGGVGSSAPGDDAAAEAPAPEVTAPAADAATETGDQA